MTDTIWDLILENDKSCRNGCPYFYVEYEQGLEFFTDCLLGRSEFDSPEDCLDYEVLMEQLEEDDELE